MSADVTLADCRIYAEAALAAFARALLPDCVRCCDEPAVEGSDYGRQCLDIISEANENDRIRAGYEKGLDVRDQWPTIRFGGAR